MSASYWTVDHWDVGSVSNGYFMVKRPDVPGAYRGGWVQRSRAIWWIVTGRSVPSGYTLHHIDGNKLNDLFGNLELLSISEHARRHETVTNPQHGTMLMYRKYECRCELCRAAKAASR